MAKPLLSIRLLENTKKAAARAKMDDTTRKRRIELVTPVLISIKKVVLSTPRASREIRMLYGFFDEGNYSIATQRLLFRKVEKGYDEKDWQLKMALRENELLKARLEAMAPVKRKKVETSPNSRFVNIRAIRRAQIAAGTIEAKSADEEGSEKSETPESCIVVGSDEDSDDVEVEG
jgi:hypothetical protein